MRVFVVEYGVFHFPKGMDGWRLSRIEYGGFDNDALAESTIWHPAHLSSDELEDKLNEMFVEPEEK